MEITCCGAVASDTIIARVQNPRLIQIKGRIINPDHIAHAEKNDFGDVVVTFPDGSAMTFPQGAESDGAWSGLLEACRLMVE